MVGDMPYDLRTLRLVDTALTADLPIACIQPCAADSLPQAHPGLSFARARSCIMPGRHACRNASFNAYVNADPARRRAREED